MAKSKRNKRETDFVCFIEFDRLSPVLGRRATLQGTYSATPTEMDKNLFWAPP